MHLKRRSFILLSVFLLSLASPLASSHSVVESKSSQAMVYSSSWDSITPVSKQVILTNPIEPVIDLASFSFDPLLNDLEIIPSTWRADSKNNLHLLQLNVNNGALVEALSLIHI